MDNQTLYNNILKLIKIRNYIFNVKQQNILIVLKKYFAKWILNSIADNNFENFEIKDVGKFVDMIKSSLGTYKWSNSIDLNIETIDHMETKFKVIHSYSGNTYILKSMPHKFIINNKLLNRLKKNHSHNVLHEDIFLLMLFYTTLYGNSIFIGIHPSFIYQLNTYSNVVEIGSILNTSSENYASFLDFEKERFGAKYIIKKDIKIKETVIINLLNSSSYYDGVVNDIIPLENEVILILPADDRNIGINDEKLVVYKKEYNKNDFAYFNFSTYNHIYISDTLIIKLSDESTS